MLIKKYARHVQQAPTPPLVLICSNVLGDVYYQTTVWMYIRCYYESYCRWPMSHHRRAYQQTYLPSTHRGCSSYCNTLETNRNTRQLQSRFLAALNRSAYQSPQAQGSVFQTSAHMGKIRFTPSYGITLQNFYFRWPYLRMYHISQICHTEAPALPWALPVSANFRNSDLTVSHDITY